MSLQGTVIAVGTSLGVTLVAQLPSISAAAAAAAAAGGTPDAQHAQQPQAPPQPMQALGEPRSEAEAVTSLGFSRVDAAADPLWLLVGHASGTVAVWDLQRRPVRLVTTISACGARGLGVRRLSLRARAVQVHQATSEGEQVSRLPPQQVHVLGPCAGGQHGLPVTHASFLPGRGVAHAVTSDRRGRLVSHTLAHNLLMMRTTAASRPLLDGSLGIITAVVHLQPFPAPWASSSSAADGGGAAAGGAPGGKDVRQAGGAQAQQGQAQQQQQQQHLVGDGMVALCAPTGCHIARFRSNGDLQLLTVVPRPEEARAGTLPAAAWGAHLRRSFVPHVLTGTVQLAAGGEGGGSGGEVVAVPCASLAVAWGHVVSFCEVPLLGDHRGAGGTSGAPPAAACSGGKDGRACCPSRVKLVPALAACRERAGGVAGRRRGSAGGGAVAAAHRDGGGGGDGHARRRRGGDGGGRLDARAGQAAQRCVPRPGVFQTSPASQTSLAPRLPPCLSNTTEVLVQTATARHHTAGAASVAHRCAGRRPARQRRGRRRARLRGRRPEAAGPGAALVRPVWPPGVPLSRSLPGCCGVNAEPYPALVPLPDDACRYDGDALGVVVLQGLQMRLAVIGPDLELREQVRAPPPGRFLVCHACMAPRAALGAVLLACLTLVDVCAQVDCFDTPLASSSLTTSSSAAPCCPESICGQGSRVLLLGASGALYCSRLMGWQERLRTLQVTRLLGAGSAARCTSCAAPGSLGRRREGACGGAFAFVCVCRTWASCAWRCGMGSSSTRCR